MVVKKILVTGSAGFIGFHLVSRLLKENFIIFGLDNIDPYYDINLKYARLSEHGIERKSVEETENCVIQSLKFDNYYFVKADLANHDYVVQFMMENKFNYVVNLAAQAGVRYSLENPRAYTHSNIDGFLSILEGCRAINVEHLIFASTSSVYGLNKHMPLSEDQKTDEPMALYAATKKANELMAHSYSHLFQFPSTGLRFFTVYGPWGRPDMALFLFADAIQKDEPINVFNHGDMIRDFTYVDDIVESIARLVPRPLSGLRVESEVGGLNLTYNIITEEPTPNLQPQTEKAAPFQVFNIGNSAPVQLMHYIEALEKALDKTAIKNFMDIQAGDVPATHADVSKLEKYVNFKPRTSVEVGVKQFVDWYLEKRK